MKRRIVLFSVMWILLAVRSGISCSTMGFEVTTVIGEADLILRATAVEYVGPELPAGTRRLWNSNIRFRIEEVIKGAYGKRDLILPGFLTDIDEWNRGAAPYRFARPSADAGCFAIGYRKGAQFLLILKKWDGSLSETIAGRPLDGFTTIWAALAPVNEQLHSADDPWVKWVRNQVRNTKGQSQ